MCAMSSSHVPREEAKPRRRSKWRAAGGIPILLFVSMLASGLVLLTPISMPLLVDATPANLNDAATNEGARKPRNNARRRRTKVAPLNVYLLVKDEFDARRRDIEDFVFQTLDAFAATGDDGGDPSAFTSSDGKGTRPSRTYTYASFFDSLRTLSVDGLLGQSYHVETNPYVPGIDRSNNDYKDDEDNAAFYLSQDAPDHPNALKYAIVNVCAFLANAMVEAIQFDACEEFNGMVYGGRPGSGGNGAGSPGGSGGGNDSLRGILAELGNVNGRYFPMANACGQLGRSYHDASCPLEVGDGGVVEDVACPVDPDAEMTAQPHPRYNYREGRPPPLFCLPRENADDHAGYWDGYSTEFVRRVAYPSELGEISVEGCCFWGRGALMTRGTCGLGRLDRFLGRRAYLEGRPSRYPQIDFCKAPSVICGASTSLLSGAAFPELKTLVALFEWVERIQPFSDPESKWEYMTQLRQFVDEGLRDESRFIDAVSGVVTRGCDGPLCSARTIHFHDERRKNFETLIHDIFNLRGTWQGLPAPTNPEVYDFDYAAKWLGARRSKIEGNVFISQTDALNGVPYFSRAFRFEPFMTALRTAAVNGVGDERYFFVANEKEGLRGLNAGLCNVAFFLANAMAESIRSDSCDEAHWEENDGRFAISNSCGQNGRDYGTEICPPWQSFMTCPINKEAAITADVPVTAAPPFMEYDQIDAQPPPFQCKPGMEPAGYWDEVTQTVSESESFPNSFGRTDVEGCAFWGRGALMTRGACNYGKLNFHIGAQAAAESRPALFPQVDFCTEPQKICEDDTTRYTVGMFEWIDRVQDYYDSTTGWSYKDELYKFVAGGMTNDFFIDQVSSIVARGCHLYPCSTTQAIETDRFLYGLERRLHFKNIMKLVFELPVGGTPAASDPWDDVSAISPGQSPPTNRPTFRPTPYPAEDGGSEPQAMPPTIPSPMPTVTFVAEEPTNSPIEASNMTILTDGGTHVINGESTSFLHEVVVVKDATTLIIERNGRVEAPVNGYRSDTEWAALRLSIGSVLNATEGSVAGSRATKAGTNGGEAIEVFNGQSLPSTASFAHFYDGVDVAGGDAADGVGGNALHVHGFGTEAFINGGTFRGGRGFNGDDGLSIYALNSGKVHIYSGAFEGEMVVGDSSTIAFYGCFMRNESFVTGMFVDETYLEAKVRTRDGGEVMLISVAEQECDTAPSMAPTNFPTVSSPPTVPRPNNGRRNEVFLLHVATVLAAFASLY